MFSSCKSLQDLKGLQNWKVSNGKSFLGMFENCTSLQDISALANWNVANGEDFESMFDYCVLLTNVFVLENWQISNGKAFRTMFGDCINLRKIQLPNTLKNLNYQIFKYCNSNLNISWKGKNYMYDDLIEYQKF